MAFSRPGRRAPRAGPVGGPFALALSFYREEVSTMARESEFGGGDKDREAAAPKSAEQALQALYADAWEGT